LRVESTSRSKAFSPVISVVIISAVVLAVGGAIWAFSQGAMTITAEDYAEAVINMTDTISERFIIEMVWYGFDSATDEDVGTGNGELKTFSGVLDHDLLVSGTLAIDEAVEDFTDDGAGVLVSSLGTPPLGGNGEINYITGGYSVTFLNAPAGGSITADYKYITGPLDIWIFNYGTVDIEVKVQVKDTTYPAAEDDWFEIPAEDMKPFPSIPLDVISKEELNIKAYTKRGNNAYYKYVVP